MNWNQRLKNRVRSFAFKWLTAFVFLGFLSTQLSLASEVDDHHGELNLKIGERLFSGLIPMGVSPNSCLSCHAVFQGDTVNFNPLRHEVAMKAAKMDFDSFQSIFGNDGDNVLAKTHVGFTPDSLQLVQLHLYLKSLDAKGQPVAKPIIHQIIIISLLFLLVVLALIDLFFTKLIPYKPLHILAILFSLGFVLKTITHNAIDLGRSENYEPDQPIKFSHKVHSGDLKIDCFYCHTTADEGKSAGIPSSNVCMNCHVIVREGSLSGKSEIAKLIEHYENNVPIEWIRIHQLPDHVYFSHAQHVKVGGLDCMECHGNIDEMHRVKQVKDLSMGWCLDCHKTHQIDVKANDYYANFEQLHNDIKSGKREKLTPAELGANDCMKCHY